MPLKESVHKIVIVVFYINMEFLMSYKQHLKKKKPHITRCTLKAYMNKMI